MTPSFVVALIFAAAGLAVVLVALPLLVRRVGPNAFYGVRIPSTLRNERVWYETNALAGRLLVAVGVSTILLAMTGALLGLAPKTVALVSGGFLVAGVVIASIRCVLFAKRLST